MFRAPDIRRDNIDRALELLKTAKVDKQEWAQGFALAAALSPDTTLERKFVEVLRPLAVEQVLRDIPYGDPTAAELASCFTGNRPLLYGFTADNGQPFVQDIDVGCEHTLVLGGTGTGKTNLLYAIALQAMPHVAVWMIDKDKQDYRHLLRFREDLMVLNV